MTSPTVIDVETTIFQKGNPFARQNKLCYVGAYREGGPVLVGDATFIHTVKREMVHASLLVGANFKFDLHWLRRCGVDFSGFGIWDIQLAAFLLSNQRERYPSLEGVCKHYGLPGKDPTIERDYWSKGIDTPDIPRELMLHYLTIDLVRTMQVYHKQVEDFKQNPKLYTLFRLQCQDLLVLQEMEWNGLRMDVKASRAKGKTTNERISEIEALVARWSRDVVLNLDSSDDLSCLLYGGTVARPRREVVGVYQTGTKVGQPRYRIYEDLFTLPTLVEPDPDTRLQKEGYWSCDEAALRGAGKRARKEVKDLIDLLLERAKLSKMLDYYNGIPDLIDKMDWSPGEIHGQLNQCTVITGRLSAEKPNQQNLNDDAKQFLVSRY